MTFFFSFFFLRFVAGPIPNVNAAIIHGISTVKRRKKSSGAINQRKMFEEVSVHGMRNGVAAFR